MHATAEKMLKQLNEGLKTETLNLFRKTSQLVGDDHSITSVTSFLSMFSHLTDSLLLIESKIHDMQEIMVYIDEKLPEVTCKRVLDFTSSDK